jgi:hypothetical protein
MMKTKTLWKSMLYEKGKLRSANGDETWNPGEWHKVDGPLAMCERGYHASLNIVDSMQYVAPGAIARVEVRGNHVGQLDKQCWSEMRVVRAWEWTKRDSVELAVYAAELVIGIFEKQRSDDKRPRQAIEAARAWLEDPNTKTRAAAWAASDAASSAARAAAMAAAWAASSAARAAARAAAWAARAAASSAASSAARAAAMAASDAASSAAWAASDAMKARIHRWIVRRTKSMKEIKEG